MTAVGEAQADHGRPAGARGQDRPRGQGSTVREGSATGVVGGRPAPSTAAARRGGPAVAVTRRRGAAVAAAVLLVALALGGCGRAGGPDRAAPASGTLGASAATTSPAPAAPREDVATPAATGPAATGVATLQQALDAAGALADEVDRDIASDNS